eukprot:TRINITY_DN58897_c0_g1_i1.p2 TRINITY_DN58897_c0_g1~~TRINITY_DN58897_c0_g1_i1.p2  ORF type:complete len:164 (+),score=52.57 TRINITY_DN58897_c0_g1_i1:23-493(+)
MALRSVPLLLLAALCGGAAAAGEVQGGLRRTTEVNCVDDPENLYCCEVEERTECLFTSIKAPRDACSIACKKRMQTLGYECYEQYKESYLFDLMTKNCDPYGLLTWSRAPTPAPEAPRQQLVVGAAVPQRPLLPWLLLPLAAAAAMPAADVLGLGA